MQHGVFISYSHDNVEQVNRIVDIIGNRLQIPVWYDHNLHGGDHYFSVIAEKILEYDYFIFVVSPQSVASEFCTMELEFAKSEKRKIIAVWLEDFKPLPRIRMVISHTHYIKYYTLSEADLQKELSTALRSEHLESNVTVADSEAPQVSERFMDRYKYFIRNEDEQAMSRLLQQEKGEKYSACFEPQAAVLLGIAYELGIHTERDTKQAEFYYRVAEHKGNADGEFYRLAMEMEQNTDGADERLARMRKLADGGCIPAMVYFGDDLYNGNWGMNPDKETAYGWWERAAEAGHPMAQYFLSYGYRLGEVVKKDPVIALMRARQSAEAHFPRAYRTQGFMYKYGEFFDKDPEKAQLMFEKAVALGDYLSLKYIGDLFWGKEEYEKSVEFYTQAVEHADAGRIKSGAPYYNLGWAYCYGQGVEKDIMQAVDLYFKGAERGHKASKKWLSLVIDQNVTDREQCLQLLKRASELDCRSAEYLIASILEKNNPPRERLEEALAWHEKGVDKGDVDCMLATTEYYGITGKWTKKFANRNKALANLRLFFTLWESEQETVKERSCKKDIAIATQYYTYAMELDIDEKDHKPDHVHALFYLNKMFETEDGLFYWPHCTVTADGYINDVYTEGKMERDTPHAEALGELLQKHMDAFLEYNKEHPQGGVRDALTRLKNCWRSLAGYYEKKRMFTIAQRELKEEYQAKETLFRERQKEVEAKIEAL